MNKIRQLKDHLVDIRKGFSYQGESFAEGHKQRRRIPIDLEGGLQHQDFIEEDLIIKISLKEGQVFVEDSLVHHHKEEEASRNLGIIIHSLKLFEDTIVEGILGHR